MGTTDNRFWIRIQQGLKETEMLMNQNQYNMSMIKARQTLEFMIHYLGEKALIVEGDLADSIDQLFERRLISQASKDHYHRIRMIGNKAVHEGNDSPYDAREALQLLSQEVQAFANALHKNNSNTAPNRQRSPQPKTAPMASRSGSARRSAPQRSSSRGRSRRRSPKNTPDINGLLKPALIFLGVLVVVLIFVKLVPGKGDKKETGAPETSTQISTEAATTEGSSENATEPETQASKIYTTKSKLNVRSTPSTDGTRLGSLAAGTVVDFVKTYDDKWTVIKFEGKEAYVATEYLTESEAPSDSGKTTESGETTEKKTQ
ncbi:SH3 domain-containing protein [Lacrimispora sp. JR3]|uniref:SH3 domain-containing protein n=1 Tax=Lacrimispora sinapis TaxID=3111456 RepID=UPI00374A3F46